MLTKDQYDLLKAKKADELTAEEKAAMAEFEKSEAEKNKEHMIPKARLDEVLQKNKELNDRLAAIEKAQKDAEEQRLIEANNYKTLYEQAKAEAEGLKPKASIADESEKTLQSVLDSQIAEIPEHFRGMVPENLTTNQKLAWISKNKSLLMKPVAFGIGAGENGGDPPPTTSLTAEEIATAKKAGMTPEEYLKNK